MKINPKNVREKKSQYTVLHFSLLSSSQMNSVESNPIQSTVLQCTALLYSQPCTPVYCADYTHRRRGLMQQQQPVHWQYTPVQSVQPLTNYYGVHSTVHQRVADSFSTVPPPKSSLHCLRLYWLLLLWLYKLYYVLFKSRTFVLTPLALSSTVQPRAQQSAVPQHSQLAG